MVIFTGKNVLKVYGKGEIVRGMGSSDVVQQLWYVKYDSYLRLQDVMEIIVMHILVNDEKSKYKLDYYCCVYEFIITFANIELIVIIVGRND